MARISTIFAVNLLKLLSHGSLDWSDVLRRRVFLAFNLWLARIVAFFDVQNTWLAVASVTFLSAALGPIKGQISISWSTSPRSRAGIIDTRRQQNDACIQTLHELAELLILFIHVGDSKFLSPLGYFERIMATRVRPVSLTLCCFTCLLVLSV